MSAPAVSPDASRAEASRKWFCAGVRVRVRVRIRLRVRVRVRVSLT